MSCLTSLFPILSFPFKAQVLPHLSMCSQVDETSCHLEIAARERRYRMQCRSWASTEIRTPQLQAQLKRWSCRGDSFLPIKIIWNKRCTVSFTDMTLNPRNVVECFQSLFSNKVVFRPKRPTFAHAYCACETSDFCPFAEWDVKRWT